jgi:hypothetical protein
MTSEPLPAECAEMRRQLAEGEAGRASDAAGEVLDHMAGCEGCTAFAAALVELEARLVRLPLPEPSAGAADRAVARFRAELAAHASPGTAPLATPPAASPLTAAAPAEPVPPSLPAGTVPPSQAPPARALRAGRVRGWRWRSPVSLAAGMAAAIALVVALVVVLGPTSTPTAYAAILREAAAHTGAEKSARFEITGAIGFSVNGHKTTAAVSGSGATEFPDRGELTEVATILGKPLLRQDIVSVGNRVWTRLSDGKWELVPIPPDHASAVGQALADPTEALKDLTRVGSRYRSLGMTTIGGTRVRRIELTIPGKSFEAFGDLAEQVRYWTVVVDVSPSLILRRITITGHGVVSMLGIQEPFTYSLQLTLLDFGARLSIVAPGSGASARCAHCNGRSAGSRRTRTPADRTGSATAAPGSGPTHAGSKSPSPGGSQSPAPSPSPGGSSPSPGSSTSPPGGSTSPPPVRSSSPAPTQSTSAPAPHPSASHTAL